MIIIWKGNRDCREIGSPLIVMRMNQLRSVKELKLYLGGVVFHFQSERELEINPELCGFITDGTMPGDILISVSWKWDADLLPRTEMKGQDALLNYYTEEGAKYCVARGGPKGPLACTSYTEEFKEVRCVLNEKPFLYPMKSWGSILRLLPMREIFLHFHVLFFHAAQIARNGKGILFSAPSGVGKSTQAKLWQKCRGVEIVCSDRTLIRKKDEEWKTYGYPMDGSEPVYSGEVNVLGAIVLLEQAEICEAVRLRPGKAMGMLMPQLVMDSWNSSARIRNMDLLSGLLGDIPVYLLKCTPDEAAVRTLEKKLIEDGVIMYE